MPAVVRSFTLLGIEAIPVEVQVSSDSGYPTTTVVGLPDKAVRESIDRVRAAFHSAGFKLPNKHITINLAPAEIRKEGAAFDLAIALGILAALDDSLPERLDGTPLAGELSLTGEVRPVRGALAMALTASRCGCRALLLPEANLAEAQEVPGLTVHPLRSLLDTVDRLRTGCWEDGGDPVARKWQPAEPGDPLDLSRIVGQHAAKRALEVAAAGGHNLLFFGPPGAGKTLLARCLPAILPSFTREESLDATLVHSVAGLLPPGVGRLDTRPFRAPHHTVTGPGLVGGGAIPRPGEVSLAHCGVLFLDEMPEFRAHVLNLLREPMEEGTVRLVRSGRTVAFPCRFMLVGAMNPCPCGFLGHPRKPCHCTPHQIKLYRSRLSGPLLDRIDLHVEVASISARELTRGLRRRKSDPAVSGDASCSAPESSAAVRERVETAREVQTLRFRGHAGIHSNAQMGLPQLEEFCRIDDPTRAFLQKSVESLSLSARAAHRSLRVARTIADLGASNEILLDHLAEAVQYQGLDRGPRE